MNGKAERIKYVSLFFIGMLAAALSPLQAETGPASGVNIATVTGSVLKYNDQTGVAEVKGDAVIVTSTATLTADQIIIYKDEKRGVAEGEVTIYQGTVTIRGAKADYYWAGSTGTLVDASGSNPPWRFTASKLRLLSQNIYYLSDGTLTSCDQDPPHYRVRSTRGKIRRGERANMKNARLLVEDFPAFFSPFYSRSLVPKKYTLRIEPGTSGRDGLTNRTILGYPFTPNSNTQLKWDWLQETGNGIGLEHIYNNPKARGRFDTYYIRDVNSDPQPKSRRYTILWSHYQKLTDRLTFNTNLDLKSDQTFGNEFSQAGNGVRVENSTRGLFSEAGLNYQFDKGSLQIDADRRDRFDSTVSSESFISKLTLPRISFNTIPLEFKKFPILTSFSGFWVNETANRADPNDNLSYQRSGQVQVQMRKSIRAARKWTFTPRVGFSESWQDRDLTDPSTRKDVYLARNELGMDVRRRLWRLIDVTAGHSYVTRFEPNRTTVDTLADDRGVERNLLSLSVVTRIGRYTRVSANSGYDLRKHARSDPDQYQHESARIVPPSLDVHIQLREKWGLYFRETYSLYDNSADRPVRTPSNTSGEIQYGNLTDQTFFSQGFSYSKTPSGADAVLTLTNKLKFFLTPKWYVDLFLSYRGVGPENLEYKKFRPSEKSISLVRDLHCWVFRMSFSERTGRREASFNIDLKTDFRARSDVFNNSWENPFYRYPFDDIDQGKIFPNEEKEIVVESRPFEQPQDEFPEDLE